MRRSAVIRDLPSRGVPRRVVLPRRAGSLGGVVGWVREHWLVSSIVGLLIFGSLPLRFWTVLAICAVLAGPFIGVYLGRDGERRRVRALVRERLQRGFDEGPGPDFDTELSVDLDGEVGADSDAGPDTDTDAGPDTGADFDAGPGAGAAGGVDHSAGPIPDPGGGSGGSSAVGSCSRIVG